MDTRIPIQRTMKTSKKPKTILTTTLWIACWLIDIAYYYGLYRITQWALEGMQGLAKIEIQETQIMNMELLNQAMQTGIIAILYAFLLTLALRTINKTIANIVAGNKLKITTPLKNALTIIIGFVIFILSLGLMLLIAQTLIIAPVPIMKQPEKLLLTILPLSYVIAHFLSKLIEHWINNGIHKKQTQTFIQKWLKTTTATTGLLIAGIMMLYAHWLAGSIVLLIFYIPSMTWARKELAEK